ncbi:nucleotidyltransferase [soil metagenome]
MSGNVESYQSENPELPKVISQEFLATLRSHGVTSASLFGSVARGEDRPDSDIDLLVQFDVQVSLFRRIGLALELSRISGRNVDLMTKVHPAFEPYILPTLVHLPL